MLQRMPGIFMLFDKSPLPCIAVLGAAVALGACSSQEEEATPAQAEATLSADDVSRAAERMERPQPGLYRSTMEFIEFDIPGLPPKQATMMREMMSGLDEENRTYCLTREQAEKGFEDVVRASQDGEYSFSRFDASGNTIDAAMVCKTPQGDANATLKGETSATRSEMVIDIDQKMPGVPGGEGHIKMRIVNERTGDCT
jgi:hypothetical protein